MINFFKSKKIIHSKKWMPGEMLASFKYKGQKYVRIAFKNKVMYEGKWPITDVPFSQVTGIRILPSPFKTALYKLFGRKARGRFILINKNK